MDIQIDSLRQGHCVKKIENAMRSAVDGPFVIHAQKGSVTVPPNSNLAEIYAAVENAGFSVHRK